jgi:hypothetical protein
MATSALTIAGAVKDAWTDTELQKQFEDRNSPLSALEAVRGTMIGTQAQVPILPGRGGSYTSVGAAGGALNPATGQPVNQALYTMPYSWFQIELETSALVQAGSQAQSIVQGKVLEVEGAVENTRHQISRQIVTNGDSIVAAVGTAAAGATIPLVAKAAEGALYGYSALRRGWLPTGQTTSGGGQYVDIGTTADTDSLTTDSPPTQIVSYVASPTAPTITLNQTTLGASTSGTHFVYIRNPNSTTAANPELNGLRQIIGTGTFGGINPATAGFEYWQAASRDTTTTTFSLDFALGLQANVLQNGGSLDGMEIWTSIRQQQNFYALLQQKVQFPGEMNMQAGDVTKPKWNNMGLRVFADILDSDWFMINKPDLVKVVGNIDKPTWASDIAGHGDGKSGMPWRQGFTSFVDAVVYPVNVGARRRNTMAAGTALT